jgi:hypothetical protein
MEQQYIVISEVVVQVLLHFYHISQGLGRWGKDVIDNIVKYVTDTMLPRILFYVYFELSDTITINKYWKSNHSILSICS